MTPKPQPKPDQAKTEKADKAPDLTPKNADHVKKAIALGKEMAKDMASNPEITKASIALAMYPLIQEESREVIAAAFVEGAGLTEKGAMTYYYNTKRKATKAKSTTIPEA